MRNLTAKDVQHAKPGKHSDGEGLILDVKASGRAYWTLRYMRDGKRRDMVLGIADRDGKNRTKAAGSAGAGQNGSGGPRVLSLLQARAAAAVERERARDKAAPDPLAARKAEREARRQAGAETATEPAAAQDRSFRAVAEAFIATKGKGWKGGLESKHALQWSATLAKFAYPKIGAKDVADITGDDITSILEPIWHDIPETASRLRGRIENVLNVAVAKRWRQDNPAAWRHLKALGMAPARQGKQAEHYPSLSPRQVPAFVHALRQKDGVSARAILFAILTAARSGEVRGMRWSEVRTIHVDELGRDCVVWHVPGDRTKTKKAHRVPLSAPALAILDEMRGFGDAPDALVFPGKRPRAKLSDMALSMLVRGMSLDGLQDGEPPRWCDNEGRPVVPHGFRASFKDFCRSARYPDEISELALAHVDKNKVRAAYAHRDMLELRVPLMDAWGEHVMRGPGEAVKIGDRRTA